MARAEADPLAVGVVHRDNDVRLCLLNRLVGDLAEPAQHRVPVIGPLTQPRIGELHAHRQVACVMRHVDAREDALLTPSLSGALSVRRRRFDATRLVGFGVLADARSADDARFGFVRVNLAISARSPNTIMPPPTTVVAFIATGTFFALCSAIILERFVVPHAALGSIRYS